MPTIITTPPTGFDIFGLNLTGYFPQPGTLFSIQRYGFDTGRRRFLINQDLATINAFQIGDPDFQYPTMLVEKVTIETVGGPWALVEVEYLGLLAAKDPAFILDTDIRHVTYGFGFVAYGFNVGLVTLQVIYITATQPDMNQAGGPLSPPYSLPPPNFNSWEDFFHVPRGTFAILNYVWVLDKRSVRVVGRGAITGSSGAGLPAAGTVLPGVVSGTNGSNTLYGTGTSWLSELIAGDTIVWASVYAYVQNQAVVIGNEFVAQQITQAQYDAAIQQLINYLYSSTHTIARTVSNTETRITPNVSGSVSGESIMVLSRSGETTGSGGAAMYEVTDSYKRDLAINPYALLE